LESSFYMNKFDHLPLQLRGYFGEFEAAFFVETGNEITGKIPLKQEWQVQTVVELLPEELMENFRLPGNEQARAKMDDLPG